MGANGTVRRVGAQSAVAHRGCDPRDQVDPSRRCRCACLRGIIEAMPEKSTTLDPSGSGRGAGPGQAPDLPFAEIEDATAPRWWRLRAQRDRLAQFEQGAAGRYWSHLSTADFMNSSFAFAALAVLSAF